MLDLQACLGVQQFIVQHCALHCRAPGAIKGISGSVYVPYAVWV